MTSDAFSAVRDPGRLAALQRLALLDTTAEEAFDRLTRLAARVLKVPVALVSLTDEDRQFFKSRVLPAALAAVRETPLSYSFCQHTVASCQPLIIDDVQGHPLVGNNPAIAEFGVVAYAGIPLVTSDGYVLGSFCVLDTRPRAWTDEEIAILKDLAAAVMTEIELRAAVREADRQAAAAERERREKDAILARITDAFFALDRSWRFTYLNPRAEQLLQRTREGLLGKNVWDEFPETVGSTFHRQYHRAVEDQVAVHFEEFSASLGAWFEVHAYPGRDGLSVYFQDITARQQAEEQIRALNATLEQRVAARTAELAATIATLRNEIAERKRVEAALRVSEAGLATAQRIAQLGNWEHDLVADEIRWSDELYRICGFAPQAFPPTLQAILGAVHPADKGRMMEAWQGSLSQERPSFDLEHRIVRPDGEIRFVQARSETIFDERGRPIKLVGTLLDITERRRAEEALRRSEASLAEAQRLAHLGSWEIDLATGEDRWSDEVYRIFGHVPRAFAPGTDAFLRLVHPDDRPAVEAAMRRILQGEAVAYECRIVRPDGEERVIHNQPRVVLGDAGRPVRLVGSVQDITERQRAQEALRRSEEQLRTIVTNVPVVLFALDQDGIFTLSEGQGLAALGLRPGQAVGQSVFDLYRDVPEVLRDIRRALAGEPVRGITNVAGLVFESSYAPLRTAGGDVAGVIGTATDVTERTRTERQRAAFSALGQRLSAARTAEEAARIIAAVADDLLGWDAYSMVLYSAADDTLRGVLNIDLVAGRRVEVPPDGVGHAPGPLSRRVMAEGGQLLLPDEPSPLLEGLLPFGDEGRPSASLMFVPIRPGADVIGILSIQSYTPNAYTAADLELLQALADHCGGALERARAEEALRRSEERFRSLVQNASDVITVVRANGTITYVSPSIERVLGYKPEDVLGTNGFARVHPDDAERVLRLFAAALEDGGASLPVELRIRHADGSWRWIEATGKNLLDEPSVRGVVVNYRDITERKAFEERLAHQAFHDPLTGLPNRTLLLDRLRHARARSRWRKGAVAVLFLDLDNFKVINDSLGHEAGDRLLVAVAARLRGCVRPTDTLARLGGDEFTILLENLSDVGEATRVAERITEGLRAPFTVGRREVFVTASIGVVLQAPEGGRSPNLLRDADIAMYRAKAAGKAGYAVFDRSMSAAALRRLELEAELRHAIERDEFRVYYQPQVALATGEIAGFEVLTRWQHPERGLIPPSEFIPLAEETGLILHLDQWVLERACSQARLWQARYPGAPPPVISVNLSARQFRQPDLVAKITGVLHRYELEPARLQLELTEGVVMEDAPATIAALHALKELEVQLAIDDFGTGYSSLSYLRRFPVDTLKIDRSFVAGLGHSPADTAIVRTVVTLGHTLGLRLIAEGVETAAQAAQLRELGCELGQGYHFAEPLTGEEADLLLAGAPRTGAAGRLSGTGSGATLAPDQAAPAILRTLQIRPYR
jgi:diguanylate cyclase (GGDEF)-like protein/PAS domain S-box-containing protein